MSCAGLMLVCMNTALNCGVFGFPFFPKRDLQLFSIRTSTFGFAGNCHLRCTRRSGMIDSITI